MLPDRALCLSTVTSIINAPIEKINIADWLFTLPDPEYQRCAHAHIAAGTTTTDDGRPMMVTTEMVSDVMIQHWVAEVREPGHCRMVSISDAITAGGRTKVQAVWELSAKKIDDRTCEYRNTLSAAATDEFLAFIQKNGITMEQAKAPRQAALDLHNRKRHPTTPR